VVFCALTLLLQKTFVFGSSMPTFVVQWQRNSHRQREQGGEQHYQQPASQPDQAKSAAATAAAAAQLQCHLECRSCKKSFKPERFFGVDG